MFRGKVKIEDKTDPGGNYFEYYGAYECKRCTIEGIQILTASRENFPDGISDEDISQSMMALINKNHACLAMDDVKQIRKNIDRQMNDKAKGLVDSRGRLLH